MSSKLLLHLCMVCALVAVAIYGARTVSSNTTEDHIYYLPIVMKPPCTTYTASMTMTSSTTTVQAGEMFTVTTMLLNTGCVDLGKPNHRIDMRTSQQPLPQIIASETHFLSIVPGSSDNAEFTIGITNTGQVTLTAVASFEVHYEAGPPVWGRSESQPVIITVLP